MARRRSKAVSGKPLTFGAQMFPLTLLFAALLAAPYFISGHPRLGTVMFVIPLLVVGALVCYMGTIQARSRRRQAATR
jgi:hypothetical protein